MRSSKIKKSTMTGLKSVFPCKMQYKLRLIYGEIRCNDSIEVTDCWCGICEEHVELCTLSELWEMFGDIPVNNDDEIEEDFLNFPAGTLKIDVWHWFDERCPNNLHDDLMYFKNDAV